MRVRAVVAIAALAATVAAVDAAAASQGQGQGRDNARGQAKQGKGYEQKRADERQQNRGQAQSQQVQARGQGQAQQSRGRGQGKAKRGAVQGGRPTDPPGKARAAAARAGNTAQTESANRGRRFAREITLNDVPPSARQFVTGNRRPHVLAAGALARAHMRGVDNELRIVPVNDGVTLLNQRGDLLVELSDARAHDLGAWEVRPFDMPLNARAPSFCRSGAGHPVWGRQWCVDKGFGLGTFQDVRWGRTASLGDVIFGRRVNTGNLATNALLGLVGNRVFDRLALHAVTLGYAEPLVGTWVTENTGPQLLLVNSGPAPVAELVDVNRDGRADLMFVALRPW